MSEELERAAKAIEELLGASPLQEKKPSGKDLREQADRVRRFRALPPRLQEGLLRYGNRIREAYLTKFR